MTIRHGTDDDLEAVQRLWELWQSDSPAPPAWADTSWDANRAEFERALAANALFLAEDDGEVFGFVSSWLEEHVARIGDLYVVKSGRREGAGRALVEAVIENLRARGATHLILSANLEALPFYEKLGFREESRNLVLPLEVRAVGGGRSYGSIHIQTDDIGGIERAIRQFVPRLPGASNGASSRRRASAGSPCTTTSATGTRRCCAAWLESSRSEPVRSCWGSGSSTSRSSASSCSKPAVSSTSISRFPSTTARCHPAT